MKMNHHMEMNHSNMGTDRNNMKTDHHKMDHHNMGTDHKNMEMNHSDMRMDHNNMDDHHNMRMDHNRMDHHNMGMNHNMMKPVFAWSSNIPVLFEHWTTGTVWGLVLAMVVAAVLGAAYELLRHYLSTWDNIRRNLHTTSWWRQILLRSYRSFLHALNALVGYLQMLFAMTYDLRLFIAIILGSCLGFFILGPYFRRLAVARSNKVRGRDTEYEDPVFLEHSPCDPILHQPKRAGQQHDLSSGDRAHVEGMLLAEQRESNV